MVNDALIIDVLAHIETEPASWQQKTYRCETGMCFAGWAATLAGFEWAMPPNHAKADYLRVDGRELPVWGVAAELITGKPYDEEEEDEPLLFDGQNDLDDLYQIAADMIGVEESVLRDKVAEQVAVARA